MLGNSGTWVTSLGKQVTNIIFSKLLGRINNESAQNSLMEMFSFSHKGSEDNYKDQNSFSDTMSLNFLENTSKISVGRDWIWGKGKKKDNFLN